MSKLRLTEILVLVVLFCGFDLRAQTAISDPGWPRYYSNGTSDLVVFQPQVDAWSAFKILTGRCAFALTPVRGRDPVYGPIVRQNDVARFQKQCPEVFQEIVDGLMKVRRLHMALRLRVNGQVGRIIRVPRKF